MPIRIFKQIFLSIKRPFFNQFLYEHLGLNSMLSALSHLRGLSDDIFACYLQKDYQVNAYLYERRLHIRKKQFLRNSLKLIQHKEYALLEQLFAQLLACAALRYQVNDHTIFSVCKDDLQALSLAIQECFMTLTYKDKVLTSLRIFSEKIKQFEEICQTVLQVTAEEPLLFVLFIFNLKRLQETMTAYYDSLYLGKDFQCL